MLLLVLVVVRRGSTGSAGASTSKRLPAAGSATLAPYTERCWWRLVLATAAADDGDSATGSAGPTSRHAPSPGFTLPAAAVAVRAVCGSARCGRVGVRLCTSDVAGAVLCGTAAVLAARLWWWWCRRPFCCC